MLSERAPHDMPAWHHQQSSVMPWWSASSPTAPVVGSMAAQWGKKTCIFVLWLFVHEGCLCFKEHEGRLEVSEDVKGHFGECSSVCVTEVTGYRKD